MARFAVCGLGRNGTNSASAGDVVASSCTQVLMLDEWNEWNENEASATSNLQLEQRGANRDVGGVAIGRAICRDAYGQSIGREDGCIPVGGDSRFG